MRKGVINLIEILLNLLNFKLFIFPKIEEIYYALWKHFATFGNILQHLETKSCKKVAIISIVKML
jgi:hypothetical protein